MMVRLRLLCSKVTEKFRFHIFLPLRDALDAARDARLGIATNEQVQLSDLGLSDPSRSDYEATPYSHLEGIF